MREHPNEAELHDWSERVAQPLRRQERLADDFEARLMAAVHADARAEPARDIPRRARHSRRSVGRWLPPLAMAASLVLAAVFGYGAARRTSPPAPAAVRDTVYVARFVLVAPGASTVALVGDFNAWNTSATRLAHVRDGVWSVALPLAPGRHEYAFLVDGKRWTVDPSAPLLRDDEFGVRSSVITVGPTST